MMVSTLDEKSIIQTVSFLRERLEEEQRNSRVFRDSIKQLEKEISQLKHLLKLEKLRSETAENALQGLSNQLSEKSTEIQNHAPYPALDSYNPFPDESITKLPNADSIKSLIYNASPAASWGSASERHEQEDLNDQLSNVLNGKNSNLLTFLKSALVGTDLNGIRRSSSNSGLVEKNDSLNSAEETPASYSTRWKEFTFQLTKRRENRVIVEKRMNEMSQRMIKELNTLSQSRVHEEVCFDYVISLIENLFLKMNNEEQKNMSNEQEKEEDETDDASQTHHMAAGEVHNSFQEKHSNSEEKRTTLSSYQPIQSDPSITFQSNPHHQSNVLLDIQNVNETHQHQLHHVHDQESSSNLQQSNAADIILTADPTSVDFSKQNSPKDQIKSMNQTNQIPFHTETVSPNSNHSISQNTQTENVQIHDSTTESAENGVEEGLETVSQAREIALKIQRLNRKSSMSSDNSFDSGKWKAEYGGKDVVFSVSNLSIPNESQDDYLNGREGSANFPPSETNSFAGTPSSTFAVMNSPNPSLSEHKFEFHSDMDLSIPKYSPSSSKLKSHSDSAATKRSKSFKGKEKEKEDEKVSVKTQENIKESENTNDITFNDDQSEINSADLIQILKETYVEPSATDLIDQMNATKKEPSSRKSQNSSSTKYKTKSKEKSKKKSQIEEIEPPYVEPSATDLVEQYRASHMVMMKESYSTSHSSSKPNTKPHSSRSRSPSPSPSRTPSPPAPSTVLAAHSNSVPIAASEAQASSSSKLNRSNSRNKDNNNNNNNQYGQSTITQSVNHQNQNQNQNQNLNQNVNQSQNQQQQQLYQQSQHSELGEFSTPENSAMNERRYPSRTSSPIPSPVSNYSNPSNHMYNQQNIPQPPSPSPSSIQNPNASYANPYMQQHHHPSDLMNIVLQMEQAPEAYAETNKIPMQTPSLSENTNTVINNNNNNNGNNNNEYNSGSSNASGNNVFVKSSGLRGTSLTPLHIPPRAPAVDSSNVSSSLKFTDPRLLTRTSSNRSMHTPISAASNYSHSHLSSFPPVAPLPHGSSDSSVLSGGGRGGLNSTPWMAVGENSPAWESPRDINIRESSIRNLNVSGVLNALNAMKSEINSVIDLPVLTQSGIDQSMAPPGSAHSNMLSMDNANNLNLLQQTGVIRIPTNSSDISSNDFHSSQQQNNYLSLLQQQQQQQQLQLQLQLQLQQQQQQQQQQQLYPSNVNQMQNYSYLINSPLPTAKLMSNPRSFLSSDSISSSVHPPPLHSWIAPPSVGSILGSNNSKYHRRSNNNSAHDSPDSTSGGVSNNPQMMNNSSNYGSIPMAMAVPSSSSSASRMNEGGRVLSSELDRSLNMDARSNLNQNILINRGLHEFTPPV